MAVGLASAIANEILQGLDGSAMSTFDALSGDPYIQLHTGDPGASGTSNVAGNATRKQVSLGTAASGAVSNDADIDWSTGEVDTSEDYTHWSLWSAATDGTFLWSGTMTANAVTSGDEFTIPSGDLDISFDDVAA